MAVRTTRPVPAGEAAPEAAGAGRGVFVLARRRGVVARRVRGAAGAFRQCGVSGPFPAARLCAARGSGPEAGRAWCGGGITAVGFGRCGGVRVCQEGGARRARWCAGAVVGDVGARRTSFSMPTFLLTRDAPTGS